MKKIAYIDISFRKNTKSTNFFIKFLKNNFKVKKYWDDTWCGGDGVNLKLIEKHNFDCIIIFR